MTIMKTNINFSQNLNSLVSKTLVKVLLISISLCTFNTFALETGVSIHKGDESKTTGFSLSISDDFSRKNSLYWTVSYNKLNDVRVDWNNRALYFSVDTIEALASYRHTPNSYNKMIKNLTFEYQIGMSVALTENKFAWPELNEERFYSEKGDINAVIGAAVKYKFSKKTSFNLGLKYQPSFSDFGSVGSIYLGFSYKFGSEYGY